MEEPEGGWLDWPVDDPKTPWVLTEEDRSFLRTCRIDPEVEKTPASGDEDGA